MAKTRDALSVQQGSARKGLQVRRRFTTEGVHPYDELAWERRDAVITNWRDGSTAFEQRGLEFPSTWSQNATNIVAQKYFRGPLGTPQREHSVRQMVDRVAGTVTNWGVKDGYFASQADAESFRAELSHLLVNQKAAFNSPVWFNVGVEPHPQCSACQPYDALISTPTGMVRIGELVERRAVGTVVHDAHGETRVRAVKFNGDKRVYRVKLRNGSFIEATGDHLVFAVPERGAQGSWLRVDQLGPGTRLHLYPHRASSDDPVRSLGASLERRREEGGGVATLTRPVTGTREASEAALAGWLQADGSVGQYEAGAGASPTIELTTVTGEEHDWVQQHLQAVFPDVRQHVRAFRTAEAGLVGRRIRLDGEALRPFLEAWGLLARRHETRVPSRLWTASNEAVAAYLRSVFQAGGEVNVQGGASRVAAAVTGGRWSEELQVLLLRLGIYSRRPRKAGRRPDRSDLHEVQIHLRSERIRFAERIGFVSADKAARLATSLGPAGEDCPDLREEEIVAVEDRGVQPVYDVQTDSGEYLSNNVRVHNCFILSVEDTMPSILNWYVEEGLIFKGGSGAGINLSTIRSSREPLGNGGEASGPVSFMRGADASAGTIKSGGKTRRAAKMVVLNVDHPDVRDFIWCKAREEHKARVLRDAGFDMDLDGRDSISIQYQNANNSVRVTDEFMHAYESDGEFDLRAVLDGHVIERTRARGLMREIARAAWECADPGMQYDTTINEWHTTPESGRINASNPCSEYMHLDNSACNLASLNLLKFLGDDGVFDVESFKHAVEIVFLAQEIIVGNSSYPTDRITRNAKDYRQLGLGYANLGALLMAQGQPYDSDGGRAWAGAITALMTGHAYRTSARVAEVTGPFAGFPKNREPMLRVIGKHRRAVDDIDTELVQPSLLQAARTAWDEALEFGEEHGYRNAQASVIAPTGCLTPDTLVTTDRGLARLGELGDRSGSQWQDLDLSVSTDEGPRRATRFFVNGEQQTRRIVTRSGYTIQGTPRHRIKVVDPETGAWVWRQLADIEPDDVVPLQLATMIGKSRQVPLPVLEEAHWTGERGVRVPDRVTADLAELVGYFMADGSLHATGLRFCVADTDLDVVERLRMLGKELFGIEAAVSQQTGCHEVALHSVRLGRWWQASGFSKHLPGEGHAGRGREPHVPSAILEANDPEIYGAFVRGLFEADGSTTGGVPSVSTASDRFASELRSLLLVLGIPTTTRVTTPGWGAKPITQVRVRNLDFVPSFNAAVGFISARKARACAATVSVQSGDPDRIRPEALGYVFEQVAVNEDGGIQPTYDLSVPDNVTYVASGFVSHNTIGLLMDCDTTGIEPDLALAKTKKLVGGGSMSIVNQTVPRALRRLGYADEHVQAILEYIAEHNSVKGAPVLREEHYPVFDCAIGDSPIHYMGHVRMMAAVQPFISGALSKCVTGETLIPTTDGLIRIGTLHEGEPEDAFRDEILAVASLDGLQKTDAFYYGGVRTAREIVLRSGHKVVGTPNHRLLVAADHGLEWRELADIRSGDHVAQQYGADLWSSLPARFDDFVSSPRHGPQKAVRIPGEMTRELAFLLGAFAAEGHITRSNHSIVITSSVESALERVAAAWRSEFDVGCRMARDPGKCLAVVVSSKEIVEFLDYLGCGGRASERRIPDAVLRSPRPMVLSFLQGLALDAYVTVAGMAKWAICLDAPKLLDDLQAVLTNLGIVHGRTTGHNRKNAKSYDEIYVCGEYAQRLLEHVPCCEPEKAARAARLAGRTFAQSTAEIVPGLEGPELYKAIPKGRSGRNGGGVRSRFAFLLDPRTRHVSRRTLERVAAIPGVELPDWLRLVLQDNLHFSPVAHVADAGEREVFDLSVPLVHAFVGNGIVNHNTVNMPESVTVEEVERAYYEGWKLGLKALAIYRDNCKVGQPLSATRSGEDKAGTPEPGETQRRSGKMDRTVVTDTGAVIEVASAPVRRRLPRTRPSRTTSFRVGDIEGYLSAGSYPDDGLGELFVKVSKQGSTLSGVMDAFAIAVSLGLQYGVPLEVYVAKFSNMIFEPNGITDDPDIRITQSLVDYIARRLAIDYLDVETRHALGIKTTAERIGEVNGNSPTGQAAAPTPGETSETAGSAEPAAAGEAMAATGRKADAGNGTGRAAEPRAASATPTQRAELAFTPGMAAVDAPFCSTCGVRMRPAGSCFVCESCGTTSGCS
ncbi:MAG TPA: LAGLIDADG family homing endonuclease [Actinomycetes bacterium]|nr:LAGLIDADG family homing endonuclease [Actinomycetes bacterium]